MLIGLSLVLILGCWSFPVTAGPLAERLAAFPQWQGKPVLKPASGALTYPDWFLGDWQVTSTLVELAAPLEPEIVTPGYADNQRLLNQPVTFAVRFVEEPLQPQVTPLSSMTPWNLLSPKPKVIADLAFNGESLARAYLGKEAIKQVIVDARFPNRQKTVLSQGRELVSNISDRATESNPKIDQWIASELFQQTYQSSAQIYLNQVENTTAYRYINTSPAQIEGNQVTAIYLSPNDPKFFQALNQPVALYRYHLSLTALP
ncbi:MAG: hypothetical protein HC934_09740 [Acaryochloridaceae cyanobacterium SU_2_1]|nr:hypothetical protein [Acaryochloridaceae cyanobacterium SU_2_1]